MPRLSITSPGDIRRQVNAVKQQHAAAAAASASTSGRQPKRYARSVDLIVDFSSLTNVLQRRLEAEDLATLINCAPHGRMESISLEQVLVVGDWQLVVDALRNSPAARYLRQFSSYACLLRENTEDMLALGEALATLPKLEAVSMGFSYRKQLPAWKILTPIVSRPGSVLRKIFVNGFYTPLQNDTEGVQDVCQFLQACSTCASLKRLVCLPMVNRAFCAPPIMAAVGHLIRTTPQMEVLELYVKDGAQLKALAGDLKHNNTLTRLALSGRHTVAQQQQLEEEATAFLGTLQTHNYTLKELHVEPWNHRSNNASVQEVAEKVEFELSLNRMGRAHLLSAIGQASTDDWMDAIANKDDPSIIYYFLRKNPSLCWTTTTTTPTTETTTTNDPTEPPAPTTAAVVSPESNNRNGNGGRSSTTAAATREDELFSLIQSKLHAASPQRSQTTTAATPTTGIPIGTPMTPTRSSRSSSSRSRRKRRREEMEAEDRRLASLLQIRPTTFSSPTTSTTQSTTGRIVRAVATTAYTAAVFCAGYWYRGQQQLED